MSKEPNGTLVMATCKCRENIKNLVMTRTFFEEQLQRKFEQGVKQERERIIKLLEEDSLGLVGCGCCAEADMQDVIALIEGEPVECECDPCGDETCTCRGKKCDFCKAKDD